MTEQVQILQRDLKVVWTESSMYLGGNRRWVPLKISLPQGQSSTERKYLLTAPKI